MDHDRNEAMDRQRAAPATFPVGLPLPIHGIEELLEAVTEKKTRRR